VLSPAQARFDALLKHLEEGVRIQTRLLSPPDPDALLQAATGLAPFWDALAQQAQLLAPPELTPFLSRIEKLRSTADSNAMTAASAASELRTELHEMGRTLLKLRQMQRGPTTPPPEDSPRTLWA